MQAKTLRKAEKPAFVYKMHKPIPGISRKICQHMSDFPYLVLGYQQYSQVYPQLLCITFTYAEGYPPAVCLKSAHFTRTLHNYQHVMHNLWITLVTFSPAFHTPIYRGSYLLRTIGKAAA